MFRPTFQPRLLRSGLTGRVYVVTRYIDRGEGLIEAHQKYDVTADYERLVAESQLALAEAAYELNKVFSRPADDADAGA